MSEKYIRKSGRSFAVVKSSRTWGRFDCLDDAIFIRNLLVESDWNEDSISEIHEVGDEFWVIKVIDERVYILDKSNKMPSKETIDELTKRKIRNPNNSRYGLNITRVFDTFIVKKRIAGDDYIFGYYGCLEDADFVRNHLMDNQWNVESFSTIQYDEDRDNYKVTEVIDDRVYVLGTFKSRDEINLDECRKEFLNKISKHKHGLASHDYLNELTDKIPDLEERFAVKAQDDVWNLKDTQDPLNDIIFNLTPFQKSVYDAVNDSTINDIERAMARFKSKNFTKKIRKSLDELEDMGLIAKNQNHYNKLKP